MIETFQFAKTDQWRDALVRDFLIECKNAIAQRGRFHVALSGGSTPKPFYLQLSLEKLPWDKIEFWIGDERCVPSEDPLSNQKMISETLLVGRRDDGHFHPWDTTLAPEEAAIHYARRLREHAGNPPIMDLMLLGIGTDGHTASLFPNTSVLDEHERITGVCRIPGVDMVRLTLTFPVLNAARQVWFLVQGKEKNLVVNKLLKSDPDIPAGRIQGLRQRVYWFSEPPILM